MRGYFQQQQQQQQQNKTPENFYFFKNKPFFKLQEVSTNSYKKTAANYGKKAFITPTFYGIDSTGSSTGKCKYTLKVLNMVSNESVDKFSVKSTVLSVEKNLIN